MTSEVIMKPPSLRPGPGTLSIFNLDLNKFAVFFSKNIIFNLSIYWTDGNKYYESYLERPCLVADLLDIPGSCQMEIISVMFHLEGDFLIDSNMKDEIFCLYPQPVDCKSLMDKICKLEMSDSSDKQLFTSQVLNKDCFKTILLEE